MALAVATGLAAEARIAGTRGVVTLIGGGRADRLAAGLETAIAQGARLLLSFGVAGGLAPDLAPGDLVVGRALIDGGRRMACDVDWSAAMVERLSGGSMRVAHADIAGARAPVALPAGKAALHRATGAIAVDMESALVARAAETHGLPFAILRAVADPAERRLPPAALVAMRADGGLDLSAVFGALIGDLRQTPTLLRLARDARQAFSSLVRARALLGADFASLDFGQL